MTNHQDTRSVLEREGATVVSTLFPEAMFTDFYSDVLKIASMLAPEAAEAAEGNIDKAWMYLARRDRKLAATVYDGIKHSVALRRFSTYAPLTDLVANALGDSSLALVDLNFRIDAPAEAHFLFSWHQDYWFSICSRKALVVWIPMMPLDDQVGGVEYFPLTATNGRVFDVKRAAQYHSYSDSIVLDEPVPTGTPVAPEVSRGDALLFTFDVLHRSRPNISADRCRWTAQLRFARFGDPEFAAERYRPGVVTKERITYLDRVERRTQ